MREGVGDVISINVHKRKFSKVEMIDSFVHLVASTTILTKINFTNFILIVILSFSNLYVFLLAFSFFQTAIMIILSQLY